jgi:pimeloyl-ACP methyl ester carboxylesterase
MSAAGLSRPLGGDARSVERPDGTRLHVVDLGAGPPVLLVHGYGATVDCWNVVAEKLVAAGRRVIAYDQRGHGGSPMGRDGMTADALGADLAAVAEELDLDDLVVVGHSMGTFATMAALADAGLRRRVRRVVLVSSETGNVFRGAPTARMLAPIARVGLLAALCRRPRLGRKLAAQACGPQASPAVVEATRLLLAATPLGVRSAIGMMQRESVEGLLPAIDVPIVALWGTADGTTPRWHSDVIVSDAPHARLVELPGVGHMVNWEAPEAIVDAVLST